MVSRKIKILLNVKNSLKSNIFRFKLIQNTILVLFWIFLARIGRHKEKVQPFLKSDCTFSFIDYNQSN